MQRNRSADWIKQARSDIQYAKAALADGFYSQVCFICQQASEKALKSVLYARGAKSVMTHSLRRLCEILEINGTLLNSAKMLDQYYITARYPDAIPEGTPHETFTKQQASKAIKMAQSFLSKAKKASKNDSIGA